jgi:hypothetical protein
MCVCCALYCKWFRCASTRTCCALYWKSFRHASTRVDPCLNLETIFSDLTNIFNILCSCDIWNGIPSTNTYPSTKKIMTSFWRTFINKHFGCFQGWPIPFIENMTKKLEPQWEMLLSTFVNRLSHPSPSPTISHPSLCPLSLIPPSCQSLQDSPAFSPSLYTTCN